MKKKVERRGSKRAPAGKKPVSLPDGALDAASGGGKKGSGTVQHQEFHITKLVDAATPKLYEP